MAGVRIDFSANTSNFNSGVAGVQSQLDSLHGTIKTIGGALGAMFVVDKISSAFGGLKNIAVDASKVAASFETVSIELEVLTGNAETAKFLLKELTDLGSSTPLEQKDLQESAKTLLQYGIGVSDVTSTLKMLGDVSMGNGEKLKSMTRVFGQVSSAQRMTMQDANQLIDAGFNPLDSIAKQLGMTMVNTRKAISDGAVSSDMLKKSLVEATSAGGTFHNMMQRKSGTIEGKISNLKDAAASLQVAFGTGLNVGLGKLLDQMIESIPKFAESAKALGEATGKLLATLASNIPVIVKNLQDATKGTGTFASAFKEGVISILDSIEIRKKLKDLSKFLMPDIITKSGFGGFLDTFISGTNIAASALIAFSLALRTFGPMPLGGVAKSYGVATLTKSTMLGTLGVGLAATSGYSIKQEGANIQNVTIGLLGLAMAGSQLKTIILSLTATFGTMSLAFKGLTIAATALAAVYITKTAYELGTTFNRDGTRSASTIAEVRAAGKKQLEMNIANDPIRYAREKQEAIARKERQDILARAAEIEERNGKLKDMVANMSTDRVDFVDYSKDTKILGDRMAQLKKWDEQITAIKLKVEDQFLSAFADEARENPWYKASKEIPLAGTIFGGGLEILKHKKEKENPIGYNTEHDDRILTSMQRVGGERIAKNEFLFTEAQKTNKHLEKIVKNTSRYGGVWS